MTKFAGALVAALCMMSVQAWAVPWKIQPGVGVGPVTLGTEAKLADRAVMSQFTREDVQEDGLQKGRAWITYKEGMELQIDQGKLLQIVLHYPVMTGKHGSVELEGEGGIKVGATVQQMEQVFGRGYSAKELPVGKSEAAKTYYAYTSKGIGLTTQLGKIIEIAVWPRK